MKIKSTAFLLGLALTAGSTMVQSEELRFSWWGGNSRHEATNEAVSLYSAKTGQIVKTEYTGFGGHLERLTTQMAGRTEPDLMQTNWNWLPIFSPKGDGYADLRQFSAHLDLSKFDPAALKLGEVNGRLNALPVGMASRVFYFNRDIWKSAGLDYPETWDDLMAAGPVFKEKLGDKHFPIVLEGRDIIALNRSYMVQKYGIPMIDEENKKLAYTRAQTLEFFQLYADMVANHVAPSQRYISSFGAANLYEHRPWINGEWAGLYMWNSAVDKYNDNLRPPMSLELGGHPMLPGSTDSGVFYKPSLLFSISKNSKQQEAAAKLLNFILNEKEGVEVLGLSRGVPLSSYAREVLTANGELRTDDLSVAGLALIETLPKNVPTSAHFENPQLVSLFQETIEQMDHEQLTVAEAADKFYDGTQRILRRAIRD